MSEPLQLDADNAYHNTKGRFDMKMIEFILLAVGAVVGAFLRYIMVASPQTIAGLPVNVLAVNVIGSFILGLFSVLAVALNLNSNYTLLVGTGFCGAFTTMSSFALETSNLMDNNRFLLVALNILANVGLSLGAIIGGKVVGETIMTKVL
jgi:fluoride exporter